MTYTEEQQKRHEAKAYNAKLTHHLYQRMVYHPNNEQYRKDYENRKSQFKAEK